MRGALLLLILWLVVGCVTPTVTKKDSGPSRAPRGLAQLPDPVPRWEPRARSGNRSPYMVFGKTYHVMDDAEGFSQTGLASWYGRKFHGRPTSSGEPYDMYALTAAHKHLPLPSFVRVTRLDTGRSIVVRVNDRGPFHGDRIIDLSYAAAVKLGYADAGVARVRIDVLSPGGRPQVASAPQPVPQRLPQPAPQRLPEPDRLEDAAGESFWVQAGAFRDPAAAEALRRSLAEVIRGRPDPAGVELASGDDALVRVRVGPFSDLSAANRMQALITFADIAGVPLIVRE
ncbi:MAG: septal ring lytic transglycosylase RlpA family protein [Pseudomonadales bacterium]|jgi:rare lipoprotein A|nr:septal ring lytic transglycosylase RlpA family protein [Pseudomonadales bacterium]